MYTIFNKSQTPVLLNMPGSASDDLFLAPGATGTALVLPTLTTEMAAKGEGARIHVGVIAQDVMQAFAAEGLDAARYALLCHDVWHADPGVPAEVDADGNETRPATPGWSAGERYGIRYEELLAFVVAAL